MISATVVMHEGAPHVEIFSSSHPVYAVNTGGERRAVRGSYPDIAPTTAVRDYEQPQCVPTAYVNIEGEETIPVEIPKADKWLIPCQAPELAVPFFVDRDDGGFAAWTYAETRDQLDIPGGRPFVVSIRSKGRTGSLRITTLDAETVAPMERCLTASGHHFLSFDPKWWPLRGVTYVELSGISAEPRGDDPEPLWDWSVTLTEVERPMVPLSRPTGWAAMPDTWAGMPDTWAAMP